MARLAVLLLSVAFLAGFAFLTIDGFLTRGATPGSIASAVVSAVVLVLLAIAVVGAIRHPPGR